MSSDYKYQADYAYQYATTDYKYEAAYAYQYAAY